MSGDGNDLYHGGAMHACTAPGEIGNGRVPNSAAALSADGCNAASRVRREGACASRGFSPYLASPTSPPGLLRLRSAAGASDIE